ncbi:YraN family protein [Thioalkalicoccus limnaeus]|uniref:UPF0102 protein ABC977_04930 n=1 Tax=Thioalkalicoccus limnaeus TaxID=120681 RepID=A0ABV4BBA0_9GAMM
MRGRRTLSDTQAVGAEKEGLARRFLEGRGLRFLDQNYRCRMGEIDLIMQDKGVLVFIEVRFRRSDRCGGAVASVDTRKQRRLISAAKRYLLQYPTNLPCRFDVLAIGRANEIDWIEDAFRVE